MKHQEYIERYSSALRAYVAGQQEVHLVEVADVGRDLVSAGIPLEEIAEIHSGAINGLAEECADAALPGVLTHTAVPLAELLIAYGLAYREKEEKAAQADRLERELRSLERLSGPPQTAATARAFNLMPVREGQPEVFDELVRQYGELLGDALEQQAYRGGAAQKISAGLRSLTEELGSLKGGPRDVVELHSAALKSKSNGASPQKARAYAEEGRLAVLETMGYLASYYRNHATGVRGTPAASRNSRESSRNAERTKRQ